ncbi:MAG: hypothetical protein K2M97_07920, partial [Muribaculaceae bacterium]|nr:hypothetical protein [Muribaculaceae bacterium]
HIQAVSSGVYTISYDVVSPVDGRHDFTLCVTDNLGNQAEASLSFNARNHMQFELMAENQDNDGYLFTLAHSMVSEATAKTVIIEDFSGARIASVQADADGVAKWNLTDDKGNRVAPGHYRAYARVSLKSAHSSSPRLDLVVH